MSNQQPRQRLTHLLLYLRRGQQIRIALQAHCSPLTVSAVLNGRAGQDTDLAAISSDWQSTTYIETILTKDENRTK